MLVNPIPTPDIWLAAPSNDFSVALAVADGLCELTIVAVPL